VPVEEEEEEEEEEREEEEEEEEEDCNNSEIILKLKYFVQYCTQYIRSIPQGIPHQKYALTTPTSR
jgi:TATA-binding protein-associated factor Taf7